MDYDKDSPRAREFFAKVQDKMHYAVHNNTVASAVIAGCSTSLSSEQNS
jgi:hypothetical protein